MKKYQVIITEKEEIDMERIYYYIAAESGASEVAIGQY